MKQLKRLLVLTAVALLASCAAVPQRVVLDESYLSRDPASKEADVNDYDASDQPAEATLTSTQMRVLESMNPPSAFESGAVDLSQQFSATETVKISTDALGVEDYIHYVFGEVLQASYILDPAVVGIKQTITLNVNQEISLQKLFSLSQEMLAERGVKI